MATIYPDYNNLQEPKKKDIYIYIYILLLKSDWPIFLN